MLTVQEMTPIVIVLERLNEATYR